MDDDERGAWQPTPPPRPDVAWESRVGQGGGPAPADARARTVGPEPHAGADAAVAADTTSTSPPPPPSRLAAATASAVAAARAGWARQGRGRRLALAGVALVAATALVTTGGVLARPSWAPLSAPGAAVDELRGPPTDGLWRTDLGDAFDLDLSDQCTSLEVVADVGTDDVVVGTRSQGYGDGSPCGGTGGRLVRLDTLTGELRWGLDLGAELGLAVTGARVAVAADGETALVSADGAWGRTSGTVARVDTTDGHVVERLDDEAAGLAPGTLLEALQVEGDAVLTSATDLDRYDPGGGLELGPGDADRLTLFAADDLSRPVWSGLGVSATQAWLLGGTLVAQLVDPAAYAVDAEDAVADAVWSTVDVGTGQVQPLPGEARDLGSVEAWGDRLVLGRQVSSAGDSVVSLVDPVEGPVWSRDLPPGTWTRLSAGCLVVSDDSGTVTCVDPDTGRARWSRELETDDAGSPGSSGLTVNGWVLPGSGTPEESLVVSTAPGQIEESSEGETDPVWIVDPATGETSLDLTLPSASVVVAASRTTGYALRSWWSSDSPPAVTAFDLADGRTLWTQEVGTTGSLSPFWRRTLVTVDDGVARGLADDVRLPG